MEADLITQTISMIDQSTVVDLLRQMVEIPSRNPPGEEKALAEFLATKAKEWGLEADLVAEPFPDRPQVVITLRGTVGKPILVLNGHMDTVPEIDESRWTVPPFKGTIKEGKLYGRGAVDMKAGLAAGLVAAKTLREAGTVLQGDLIIQAAVGEETGEPGTKHLLMDKGIKGDWGIVLEPTELRIATAERGLAWFHITAKGVPGHASRPSEAVNPIPRAAKIVEAIEAYNRELAKRNHSLLGQPTVTVTMLQAGTKENVIPGDCLIAIDRRTIPGETTDSVEAELRNLLDQIRRNDSAFDYEIKIVNDFPPAEIPTSHELVGVISHDIGTILGRPAQLWGTPYGSDVRHFVNDAGIPAVTFGPGSIAQAHALDEYVEIEQVVDCCKVLVGVAIDLLGNEPIASNI